MSDKIYFNSISIKEGKYGLKVSINYNKFVQEAQQHINQKGYVNLDFNKRREEGKYGDTHYATLNTWTPEKKQQIDNEPDNSNDLPF